MFESKRLRRDRMGLHHTQRDGLARLLDDVRQGNNLTKYLSTQVLNIREQDGLLADWRVHHFHLGAPQMRPDGFIERTDELLFAHVTETEFRAIGIFRHGASFGDPEVLKAFRDEWPQIVDRGHLKGVVGTETSITPAERRKLRAAGVTPLVDLGGGDVFIGPGLGLTTAGHSINAARQADAVIGTVHRLWRLVVENADELRRQVGEETKTPEQRLVLSLRLCDNLQPFMFEHRARFILSAQGNDLGVTPSRLATFTF